MSFRMQAAPLAKMDQVTLYRMLQLRTDVFVVEQQCAYPELDGRDLETGSLMVWAESDTVGGAEGGAERGVESDDESDTQVIATLRILRDATAQEGAGQHDTNEVFRIGRVTAHPAYRGSGLARSIVQFGLEQCAQMAPHLAVVLDAQEPLEGWYESFGFVRTGPTFLEDDIPHVPMRREPSGSYT